MKANEPKHTPGPWEIVTQEPGWIDIGKKGTETTSSRVASVPVKARGILNGRYVRDKETAEANARLIAAAPDLLEACEALLQWEDTTGNYVYTELDVIIQKAMAAVVKATGKEAW